MVENIINTIQKKYFTIEICKNLLAISGGVDSMVMLDIFKKMNADFEVVHCNFKLRAEESNADEEFVRNFCFTNNIKCITQSFDTEIIAKELKLSIQETARKLRYDFFAQLIQENNYKYVLTAHNLNDNFETFMINLSRGTGLSGLLGIPSNNGNVIRPIDFLSRKEILEYAQLYHINWREDSSNVKTKYLRNKIRHQVTPIFEEINPSFLKTFSKTLENLNKVKFLENEVLNSKFKIYVKINKKGDYVIDLENLTKTEAKPDIYLYGWFQEYGFKDWKAVSDLMFAETGKIVLGKNCFFIKDKKTLILKFGNYEIDDFCNQNQIFLLEKNENHVDIGVKITQEKVTKAAQSSINKIYVDQDLITYPLLIRKCQKTDVIFPTGMQGSKKVIKFFKDQNMSLFEKENIYLLTNRDDRIIWIIGHRQDKRFIINKETQNIVKFEIE